jgi:predicted component of type VI protein secretion system
MIRSVTAMYPARQLFAADPVTEVDAERIGIFERVIQQLLTALSFLERFLVRERATLYTYIGETEKWSARKEKKRQRKGFEKD